MGGKSLAWTSPLPFISPVTLARSLSPSLGFPVCTVGITELALLHFSSPFSSSQGHLRLCHNHKDDCNRKPDARILPRGEGRTAWSVGGGGEGVSRGPGPSLGAVSGDLHPPKAADGQAPPRQGPVRVLHAPVSLQSEEKFRCVSDSQCGPERFPGVGECSPFPTPHCPALSAGPWRQHVPPRGEATLREGVGVGLFHVSCEH